MVSFLGLSALAGIAHATNLFIADYSGIVTTASLTSQGGKYTLSKTFTDKNCAPNPSWLTLDHDHGLLYCLNEGLDTVNGSLSSYTINSDSSLHHVQNTTTISGPVSGVIYGPSNGPRAIALAHYSGSAVSTWNINNDGTFKANQHFDYTLSKPGAVPDRQDAPHEHEAILDPTGQYILVPDLGADVVRVFSFDSKTLKLNTVTPLTVPPGTGPRHAVFWKSSTGTTYFYLAAEIGSTLTGYSVQYGANGSGLKFTNVYNSSTFGDQKAHPTVYPAEIQVSPDNRFLVISNRNDKSFTIPAPSGAKKMIPSDSLATFALHDDGKPTFTQLAAAGGSFPRHFSLNKAGNLVAVGLQNDNSVVIQERNVTSGTIGKIVAYLPFSGQTTNVIFDE